MKEKILNILNQNGYKLTKETTLLDMAEIIHHHKTIIAMLTDAKIITPAKKKYSAK